jgi:hypothetical protein
MKVKRKRRKRKSRLRSGKRLGVAGVPSATNARLLKNIKKEGIFRGELMRCVVCGAEEQSSPEVESQWRCVVVDEERFYVCPNEFPSDELGTREEFKEAYLKVMKRILSIRAKGLKEAESGEGSGE